jgi:hypothetical protein
MYGATRHSSLESRSRRTVHGAPNTKSPARMRKKIEKAKPDATADAGTAVP